MPWPGVSGALLRAEARDAHEHSTTHWTAPTQNYLAQNASTGKTEKSCSGRIPKLLTGLPLRRRTQDADGKEFKIFSIYYLQYSSFSNCVCITSKIMKERKRRILWTLFSIEVLTLWGMDPFENLEENRDPQAQNKETKTLHKGGTVEITWNVSLVKKTRQPVLMVQFKLGFYSFPVGSNSVTGKLFWWMNGLIVYVICSYIK